MTGQHSRSEAVMHAAASNSGTARWWLAKARYLAAALLVTAIVAACAAATSPQPVPEPTGVIPMVTAPPPNAQVTDQPSATSSQPAGAVSAQQAARHVGSTKTVCGDVASATYASSSSGRPTFLNLDRPYPQQIFTIVIWEEWRSRYPQPPERMLDGMFVCVEGRISTYRGVPQIEARANLVYVP